MILSSGNVYWSWYILLNCAFVSVTYSHDRNEGDHFKEVYIHAESNQLCINTTINKTEHVKNLTLTVPIDGRTYSLNLKLNTHLFPASYVEHTITPRGSSDVNVNIIRSHCYYIGSVQGYPHSIAGISSCNGIVGMFTFNNETYNIEPSNRQTFCLSCRHNIYSGLPEEHLNKFKCGTDHTQTVSSRRKRSTILDWPQDLYPQTKITELYSVITNDMYVFYNSNYDTVTARAKTLINIVSAIYQPLDIYVVLVGLQVWTERNMITIVQTNASLTLENFYQYTITPNNINVSRDDTQLMTNSGPFHSVIGDDGVLGIAKQDVMCTPMSVHLIVNNFSTDSRFVATVISHEMGHNFGLLHDDKYSALCTCDDPSGKCIMWSTTSSYTNYWSSCSKQYLTQDLQISDPLNYCLYNMPTSVFDTSPPYPTCGDGLIQTGEQCDCGNSTSSECNKNCCDRNTCQLIGAAQCAFGRCCNIPTCTFKPALTVCRPNATTCDLSEYCSGTDGLCPTDVFRENYIGCMDSNSVSGFCYSGVCPSRQSQCQAVWGPGVGEAVNDCYTKANVKGDTAGNCGFVDPNNYTYFKTCSVENALCGLLQCNGATVNKLTNKFVLSSETNLTYTNGTVALCRSVLFPSDNTAGMVPNGAVCGTNMVCLNQACIPINNITTTPTTTLQISITTTTAMAASTTTSTTATTTTATPITGTTTTAIAAPTTTTTTATTTTATPITGTTTTTNTLITTIISPISKITTPTIKTTIPITSTSTYSATILSVGVGVGIFAAEIAIVFAFGLCCQSV